MTLEKQTPEKPQTHWWKRKCLALALATTLNGIPLKISSQNQNLEKVSPKTERVDKIHQEEREKETKNAGGFFASCGVWVPIVTGLEEPTIIVNGYAIYPWFDFDPNGTPILPKDAVVDLDEVIEHFEFGFEAPSMQASFFLSAGNTCRVKLPSNPFKAYLPEGNENIRIINDEEIEVLGGPFTIIIEHPDWFSQKIAFRWIYDISVVREQGDTIKLTSNTEFFINPKGFEIPENLPWIENTLSWECKIWVKKKRNWYWLSIISKQETNGADERVGRKVDEEYKTVSNFFETNFSQNPDPSFANNPYHIEKITKEDKVYILKIYKIAFDTNDDHPAPQSAALWDVFFFKVLHSVETANTLTTTPSIEWENWSGTIELSDTDNVYPAWTPVPTWVPLSLNITPAQGSIVKKVMVNGVDYGADLFIENIVFSWENQNNTIKIICENQNPTHSINIINWGYGTAEILDAQGNPIEDLAEVPNGTEIQVKATSNEGYYVSKIEINGVEHVNNTHINPFIVDAVVNSDMTIEISYEIDTSSVEVAESTIKIWTSNREIIIMPGGEWISDLRVYSMEGKLVNAMRQISGNDAVYISISQPGVYVVSFMVKGKRENRKVVVE